MPTVAEHAFPGARPGPGAVRTAAAGAVLALALAGCAAASPGPLPAGGFDYQLGGAYDPAEGVAIVVRDSEERPEPGLFSVCYVNAFQTQPADLGLWEREHPDLLLRDAGGRPVADPDWPDERLLDTSTADRRERIAGVVGRAVARCADSGFDAVEFDNLDSHVRSQGLLTLDGNLDLAGLLVDTAHGHGLLAAQKNAAEAARRGRDEAGFDFAVAESCAAWGECGAYTRVYGADGVLAVEYPGALADAGLAFAEACGSAGVPPRTVLRDRELVPAGHRDHVFASC